MSDETPEPDVPEEQIEDDLHGLGVHLIGTNVTPVTKPDAVDRRRKPHILRADGVEEG